MTKSGNGKKLEKIERKKIIVDESLGIWIRLQIVKKRLKNVSELSKLSGISNATLSHIINYTRIKFEKETIARIFKVLKDLESDAVGLSPSMSYVRGSLLQFD